MARTYKRDGNGRFAGGGGSSGGGGGKRPAAKSVSRGVNRLTRDNAGKITSVGGEGATARGGRLKTAAGNKRAMQTAKVSGGRPAGTMKGKIKRDPGAAGKIGHQAKPATKQSKRKAVGAISEAKAGRIIARMDANRPGLRPASGSNRKTTNAIKTHKKASDFALAASSRARKQGKNLSVNESLQRGVKNANKAAAAKRKPKPTNAPTPSKKPTSKAGTATSDIAARRARANAPKASMYLSQKLNTQSAITRSAANAIYNEQRSTLRMQKSKQASPDVIKSGLIGRGLSGSKRDRAMANREAARKRVVGGSRR
jgi:hypothetical protein